MSIIEHANEMGLVATLPLSIWAGRWSELTAATVFPIAVGLLLVFVSLAVAVRSILPGSKEGAPHVSSSAVALLVGSIGVSVSLVLALAQPASLSAFVVGAVGASCCYVSVLIDDGDRTVAVEAVALLSVLWIAGLLTVGVIASGNTRHYALGGLFGILSTAIPVISDGWHRWRGHEPTLSRAGWRGWLFLGAMFLFPTAVGAVFGEEFLFVTYLIAFVLGCVLWWFSRLAR